MKVLINISSWVGISGGAQHYYGKVCEIETNQNIYEVARNGMPLKPEKFDLERVLDDEEEVKYLNKKDDWNGWKIGNKTSRFNSISEIRKVANELYPDSDIAFLFDYELESEDRDVIERKPHIPEKTGKKIEINNFEGFSPEFKNLTEGSIHEVIGTPERYKGTETLEGVWVMGVTEPVKVLRKEFIYVK